MRMWACGISVYVSFSPRREKKFWECHARMAECQDTITLLETFLKMWKSCPAGKPIMIGVTLYDLVPEELHNLSMFEPEARKRGTLSQVMDAINTKYGSHTLYLGGLHNVRNAAPLRIAFSSIPDFE